MRISDFTYELPADHIAKYPTAVRGTSRLLVLHRDTGILEHRHYGDITDYVSGGDLVVLNDTKVIRARLQASDSTGKLYELLLLESHAPDTDIHTHRALYRGKVHAGMSLKVNGEQISIGAIESEGVAVLKANCNLFELAEKFGTVPLPPYLKREATEEDIKRYQTEFASKSGSVAAPTASLNFTNRIKNALTQKGVNISTITLHVGLGTFLPIRTDSVEKHVMHSEYFEIPASTTEAILRAKANGKQVIAIGTTVTRTLEYAAKDILNSTSPAAIHGEADIFIYPGYTFRLVDALLTNFHAPKSTVLMMAAAFAGWNTLKNSYETALQEDYQFLSYGDSMFIC